MNLSFNATEHQINDSYRKLALKFHPDRVLYNDDNATWDIANERFREISEAYENLSD